MKNNTCDKNNLFFEDMLLFLLAVCAGSLGLVVQYHYSQKKAGMLAKV